MASTFTTNFGIEEIATGEQSETWGDTTNFNFDILDRIAAYKAVGLSGTTHTLTVREASPGQGTENLQDGMYRAIKFTGALGGNNTVTVAPNSAATYFIFENATTDSGSSGPYSVIISQGSGANVTIENGKNAIVYCDGAGSGAAVINALGDLQVDTLAGTLSTAAQTNITSLGTLTALTVDDVAVNGKIITMTGSSSDTAVFTAGTNGTLSIVTTDAAAAAANIQITADGTVDIDSAGVLTLDSGAAINIEPASGSAILLDGTISVDAGVVTGATSITSTAFVGNVTGNTSGTAATVTTAAQPNITSLGTLTTLTVDNIIINGTNIGHTSDTDSLAIASDGVVTFSQVPVFPDDTVETADIQDNAVTLAKMASGTDGNIISYDASGNPVAIATGSDGQVLTSTGAGSPPAFEDPASGGMTSFQLEDDDGTEVTISNAKEVKFIGDGLTTNWTDTSHGTDGDPYDMTFSVDAAQTGITSLLATDIKIGEDDQTKIDFETADEIHFYAGNEHQIKLVDGALVPASDNNIDLGTSSVEFKDAFFDGTVTSDAFAGPLTGDVTGNVSGTAATVTTAAQGNITSLGTLTALTVDDVAIDGKAITMTGSSSDTAVFTAGTNGTLSIVTTDAAAAAANIQITADGTVDIDSAGVLTLDSGAAINIEPASGSAILLDGTISVDAGVVTGATSITSTAFVGDITGNVTGNTSGTAATVTTAAQGNITSLGTLTSVVIADDGNIGSASDTDAISISSGGMFTFNGTNPRFTGGGNTYQSGGESYLGRDAAGNYAQTEADGFITYYDADSYTYIRNQDGTGGAAVFHARRGGSTKSEIEENGDYLSATGSYGTISDERLKEHIIDSGSQWNDVRAMRIRKFSFIEDETDGPTQLGVIAQELEASGMGGLVKTHADVDSDDNPKLDEDGNPTDFKSVKLSILYMKAVKALQEAMERIESLESRIEALES